MCRQGFFSAAGLHLLNDKEGDLPEGSDRRGVFAALPSERHMDGLRLVQDFQEVDACVAQIAGGPWHDGNPDAGSYQAHNRVDLGCVLNDPRAEPGLFAHRRDARVEQGTFTLREHDHGLRSDGLHVYGITFRQGMLVRNRTRRRAAI